MDEDAYKLRHSANLPTPAHPAIYDVDIPIDTLNVVRDRRKVSHTAKKEDYKLFVAADRKTNKFILAVVKDTWVRKLRDPDLVYAAVKTRDLLKHLQAMCVGLHATDAQNLQNEMQMYHEDMEEIPEYIEKLEDTKKHYTRAGSPIKYPTLLLFAANAMLRTNCFPRAN